MSREQLRCLILGKEPRISNVAKMLQTSDIPTRSLVFKEGCEKEILQMVRDGLELIAIFCADVPFNGADFIRKLEKEVKSRSPIHVFVDEGAKSDFAKFKHCADEATQGLFIEAITAATAIKRKWFPVDKETGNRGQASAVVTRRVSGVVSVSNTDTSSAKSDTVSATKERPAPRQIIVVTKLPESVVSQLQPSSLLHEHRAPEPKVPTSGMGLLLRGMKRNTPLPPKPIAMDITKKGGMVIELDPRRIKPLPNNPRSATNPGFSKESIRVLGQNMKAFGQVEEGLVCPIAGDQNYDAQLIDGERRHRGALDAGIMFKATVRDDITPEMAKEMYLVSVMRNTDKEPHTTLEYIHMVGMLRGPEYAFTLAETASFFGRSPTWVMQHEMLGRLHPKVLEVLDGSSASGEDGTVSRGRSRGGRLTPQLALLLHDVAYDNQLTVVQEILRAGMDYNKAHRYVVSVRRGLGLRVTTGKKNRSAQWFQTLGTLTKRSIEQFGLYLDMPTIEVATMLANRTSGEKVGVVTDLRELSKHLTELAERLQKNS